MARLGSDDLEDNDLDWIDKDDDYDDTYDDESDFDPRPSVLEGVAALTLELCSRIQSWCAKQWHAFQRWPHDYM